MQGSGDLRWRTRFFSGCSAGDFECTGETVTFSGEFIVEYGLRNINPSGRVHFVIEQIPKNKGHVPLSNGSGLTTGSLTLSGLHVPKVA
jgi:hypothetical protein